VNCPHCSATHTKSLQRKTALGYPIFRCHDCECSFNERTGTPFNFLEYPSDIVLLVVLWRLRYRLTLRDLAEMFLERGFQFTHEAVREWEERFAPRISHNLRAQRRGKAGISWYVDETYLKVHGRWCYLYRAIDRDGNLVDSLLSQTRDLPAAKRFFRRAKTVVGQAPLRVTSDGHDAYPQDLSGFRTRTGLRMISGVSFGESMTPGGISREMPALFSRPYQITPEENCARLRNLPLPWL